MKDDGDWEIVANARGSGPCAGSCKHCRDFKEEVRVPGTPNEYTVMTWEVPRSVVAWNQGGYDCTSICLDCILEAM